jgi:hypothetical protein
VALFVSSGLADLIAPRTAKTIPAHIERRFFPETRITGFRLAA